MRPPFVILSAAKDLLAEVNTGRPGAPPSQSRRQRHAQGFTLVELLVSIAVTMVIVVGIGSSMLIASRAMPDANNPANATIAAGQAAEQLSAELQYAITINGRSATMIDFTVADRNSNGINETIRYEWSGTPGDSLTRQYNAGSVVDILDGVQQFNLSYDLEALSDEEMGENESAETLLISYDSTEDLTGYRVRPSRWYGQYFLPSLPADAISWKVTRVEFFAKVDWSPTGKCGIQLRLPTEENLPSGVILEQKEFLEATLLDTYLRQEFTFSNVSRLSPDQGLCLIIRQISGWYPGKIRGQYQGVSTPNSHLVRTYNGGASWWAPPGDSLLFSVYGTVTTSGVPQIQNTYTLEAVGITLRAGSEEQTTVYTGTRTPNKPKVVQ